MNKVKIVFVVGVLISILVSCSSVTKQRNSTTGSELIGGSFQMENHLGENVSDKDFLGKYSLVFFGFTNCKTVCPVGMSKMGRVMGELPDKVKSQIQPIFVSVDPKRDSIKVISKYIKIFGKDFIGLRGSKQQTKDMVKKYRGFYRKVDEADGDYMMDHSDIIYLMDKTGKYVAHFSSSSKKSEIVKKIKKEISMGCCKVKK